MKGILPKDFLALILSVAVVGLGLDATLPLTALALTQAGHGTDIVGLMTAAMHAGGRRRRPCDRTVREPHRGVTARARRSSGDPRSVCGHRHAVLSEPVAMGRAAPTMRRGADTAIHHRRSLGHATRGRFNARPGRRHLRDQFHAVSDDGSGASQRDRRMDVAAFSRCAARCFCWRCPRSR